MGSICESKSNKIPNNRNDYLTDNFDIEEQTLKFNNFIFEDNIQDFIDKKYDLNDPIFRLIRADEKKILEKFYRANKNDMQNDMTLFLKKIRI